MYATIEKYWHGDNYLVEWNDSSKTLVFFSSNGIVKDTAEDVQLVCQKDHYEWRNTTRDQHSFNKIFLRDLKKTWYLRGISSKIDSVEAVCGLLCSLTRGTEIVTVGNSAGGYAALLFGCLLQAKYTFSFSGQFNISSLKEKISPSYYGYLHQCLRDASDLPLDLRPLIAKHEDVTLFHFFPVFSENDRFQYQFTRGLHNIRTFRVISDRHGYAPTARSLQYLFEKNRDDIVRLHDKVRHKMLSNIELGKLLLGESNITPYELQKKILELKQLTHQYGAPEFFEDVS